MFSINEVDLYTHVFVVFPIVTLFLTFHPLTEIADTCSLVVADGSRTFRVKTWEIGKDAVEVVVDCRLRTPPIGEQYFEAREDVLEAIARAVERAGVEFAKKK